MAYLFIKPRAGRVRLGLYLLVLPGLALAVNGWIFASGAGDWASSLENPAWSPPGPVIGAVWVVLFALMAVSLWLVDRAGAIRQRGLARALIGVQYVVNLGWTYLYFALQSVFNGFWMTALALLVSLGALAAIGRARPVAALVYLPLVGWLVFALALSFATWRLNA